MPKMIVHAPEGTFDAAARQQIAAALTELGLTCEALPKSPFVKSTVWTYFNDYAADAVFMGGRPATVKIVSLQVYVIAGGLDEDAKRRLIEGATFILDRHPGSGEHAPVYVVIHEIAERNWGIFGATADLEALRASAIDAPALGSGVLDPPRITG